jgi:23S rRNA G2445 N2-methylase RlmL
MHRFAVVVPPELRELCYRETIKLGVAGAAIGEVGVEFDGKLASSYLVNLWSRTASRVLLRMPEFRAGAAEDLFQRIAGVRWELWLASGLPLEIIARVEYSRVRHEGLVADTVFSGIRKRLISQGGEEPQRWERGKGGAGAELHDRQKVLVRLVRNRCVVSLDTSGRHLHRRGYRIEHGGAPLRETLAAAILMRSGWRGERPLLDGMCGSGTLAIEAALLARNVAPGLRRGFLFERWPSFQGKTWQHLRRQASESAAAGVAQRIVGIDLDSRSVEIAAQNARRAGVERDIEWTVADLFSVRPETVEMANGLLVINPPYGKRMGDPDPALYDRLGKHLKRFFRGWQVAVLAPEITLARGLRLPDALFWSAPHGGLPVVVAMARL